MQLDLNVIGDDNTENIADSVSSDSDIPSDDENIKKKIELPLDIYILITLTLCVQ